MHKASQAALVAALILVAHSAAAQSVSSSLGLVVYPTKNQAASQIATDEGECHAWARQNTGVDPANPMAGVQAPQAAPPPGGGVAFFGLGRHAAGTGRDGRFFALRHRTAPGRAHLRERLHHPDRRDQGGDDEAGEATWRVLKPHMRLLNLT